MSTSAINPTNNISNTPTAPASPTASALASQNVFLQLLVAQLKYQNPDSPADGTAFITQLAEFSNLSNTTEMASDLDAIKVALAPAATTGRRNDGNAGTSGTQASTVILDFSSQENSCHHHFLQLFPGLSANTTAIDVVGNNLANLNTPGFKADTITFQNLVTESIGAGLGATQVGFGVGTPITLRSFRRARCNRPAGRWTRPFKATDSSWCRRP